eukprot:15340862-Ditylum_brightwellii.AAC.2
MVISVKSKSGACSPGVANILKHCPLVDIIEHIASINQKDASIGFLVMLLLQQVHGVGCPLDP